MIRIAYLLAASPATRAAAGAGFGWARGVVQVVADYTVAVRGVAFGAVAVDAGFVGEVKPRADGAGLVAGEDWHEVGVSRHGEGPLGGARSMSLCRLQYILLLSRCELR